MKLHLPWIHRCARSVAMAWPLLLLPAALRLRRDFAHCAPGLNYNVVLFRTFKLELWFAALLSAGAVLGRIAA